MNNHSFTIFTRFDDRVPDEEKKYFTWDDELGMDKKRSSFWSRNGNGEREPVMKQIPLWEERTRIKAFSEYANINSITERKHTNYRDSRNIQRSEVDAGSVSGPEEEINEQDEGENKYINCLVTMYDEAMAELQKTLTSLAQMEKNTQRKLRVLVVLDGWRKTSSDAKDYLINMIFPNSSREWKLLQQDCDAGETYTYIIQPVYKENRWLAGSHATTWVTSSHCLSHLSFLIKLDNRQKFNSHDWFTNTFLKEYKADYAFMTDVGTVHHEYCLSRLEGYMDMNTGVVGCHGYPWIADTLASYSWIQLYLSAMQEYELGPSACDHDRGFQSLFGFQQTLSGPCAFVRVDDWLYQPLLDKIADTFHKGIEEVNIFQANLNIVEDTADTLYLFATSGKMLSYVPDAYYYYDVETEPARFMTQRRRWMNGVACGLLIFWKEYVELLNKSIHENWLKHFTRFLLFMGIVMQALFPFVQPGVYAYTIFQSLNPYFCKDYDHVFKGFQEKYLLPYFPWLPIGAVCGYLLWFNVWVIVHSLSKRAFIPWMYWISFAIAHTFGLYGYYYVMTVTLQVALILLPVWQRPFIAGIFALHYGTPVITSLIKKDVRTLKTAVVKIIPYLLYFPMWTFMYGYNISRLWDVSWGNREGCLDEIIRNGKQLNYKKLSRSLTYIYITGMTIVTGGFCYTSMMYNGSSLHAVYVLPWYLFSAFMGAMSLTWTVKYMNAMGKNLTNKSKTLFRYNTAKKLRKFAYDLDNGVFMNSMKRVNASFRNVAKRMSGMSPLAWVRNSGEEQRREPSLSISQAGNSIKQHNESSKSDNEPDKPERKSRLRNITNYFE